MTKLWSIAVLSILAGCDIGFDPDEGDEHEDPEPPPVSGTISSDTVWKTSQRIEGTTVIASGVTVTVDAGTQLTFAQGAGLKVEGALVVNGTQAAPVTAEVEEGGTFWGPIDIYGGVHLTYADFTSGALVTNGAAATLEITDSRMYRAPGDYIIMNGGNLNMQYSQLGPYDGETDTTHCNLHINAAASISVVRSNIAGAPYGIMYYGGIGSNFQLNNWYGNTTKDIDTKSGVEGNFSFSWFENGTPSPGPGATLILENLATERIVQAGPRRAQ